jgi:hypothetical protein
MAIDLNKINAITNMLFLVIGCPTFIARNDFLGLGGLK